MLTAFAAHIARERENHNHTQAFEQLASSHTKAIFDTLHILVRTELESLARFYEHNVMITPQEFQSFAACLTNNPAAQAWEWIPAVTAADRTNFEAQTRAAGMKDFAIWQQAAAGKRVPATDREVYYPVLQVAPMADNQAALGFDLGSDPLRREALEAAAHGDLITSTTSVTLVQETGKQKGMLI